MHFNHLYNQSLKHIGSTMANFLILPPELREQIYLELLVDPSSDANRIMLTLDKNGQSVWDRITEISPDEDELDTDIQPALTQSSIKHMDYSNLWSLARVNRLLYRETVPIIYANACLEYTFGDSCSVSQSPDLFRTFVNKLPAATCALYRQLTIVNGKDLSAKAMSSIVDIINTKLPNLVSLEIRAIDPRGSRDELRRAQLSSAHLCCALANDRKHGDQECRTG